MDYQTDIPQVQDFLLQIIKKHADEKGLAWLGQQAEKIKEGTSDRSLYLAFSSASRFFSRNSLVLPEAEQSKADQLRKGFQPAYWDLLQTARTYLLLQVPSEDSAKYFGVLEKLFETADMYEQTALYAALPLLPYPIKLKNRSAEGIRTNMTMVFDAVALHNPYPADYLSEDAWNQMVLKAVFMQRPLYQIYGADQRANAQLAHILIDFAHERWAAHRNVMPELWRFVGPFLKDEYLPDIEKVIKQGEPLEVEAGLLACVQSSYSGSKEILHHHPEIKHRIETGLLTWQDIGQRYVTR